MNASPRWAGWWMALGMAVVLAACGPDDDLAVRRVTPLADSAASTLHVSASGAWWLGTPGALLALDSGSVRRRIATPGRDAAAVAMEHGGRVVARAGGEIAALGVSAAAQWREHGGTLAADPRGRFVLRGTPSGAVFVHDAATLEPLSVWAALGERTTALAVSPEGDLAYHAIAGGANVILWRDLQTGRVLARTEIAGPVRDLRVAPDGTLFALLGETGERAQAAAFRPVAGELRPLWRRTVAGAASEEAALRLDPRGTRLVTLHPTSDRPGLHVLDAETGAVVASSEEVPRDAAFSADGRLLLLYPAEVREIALPEPVSGAPSRRSPRGDGS